MTIPQQGPRKPEAFLSGVPDAKPAPKLRGKRKVLTFTLPPELVARVDAKAARERRSRANMIEVLLQGSLDRDDASQAAV